jgi:uncharacterized OB-fold protein
VADERAIPAPATNPENEPFFAAARGGELLLKRCLTCDELHYYPRAVCPFCASERTEWVAAGGEGTIYSYSVMRRVPEPYAIAYVTLDEGVTVLTNLVDCDFERLRIGDRVRVVFKPAEGDAVVPCFTPVASA